MQLKDEHDYDPTFKTKDRVKAKVPESVDIAIVGAGLGGLTAGAYLAQAGYKVAVFDHHYVAGGCCTQFSRGGPRHRYNFDIGLHYIGDCGNEGAIPRYLAGAGVNVDYVPMDNDGFDTLVFPDFQFPMPVGHDRFRDRFVEMFPSEKRGIDRYVKFLKEIDEFGRRIQAGPTKMGMTMWAMTQGRLAAKYQNGTLKDVLDSCTKDPQVQAVMAGQNGDYGLPPSKVSSVLHAGLTNHYFKGAYYPKGGGQVPADKLAQRIEDLGGSVHLRCGIEEIVVEGGVTKGVKTEGSRRKEGQFVAARAVLSNADVRVTFEKLIKPENLPENVQKKSQEYEMAAAIFMSCMGVKGDMQERGMRRSNYWQFDSYDFEEFYNTEQDMKPRGAYITSGSLKDPDTTHHAPDGFHSLEAMTVMSGKPELWGTNQDGAEQWNYKKTDKYLALKEEVEKDLIERVENLFPGSKENLEFIESASPMSHIRYTRATDGTGYGMACTPDQFFLGRPGPQGPIEGLFLAGANTRSGHGVLGAIQSGHKAAKRIAKAFDGEVAAMPDKAG